MAGKGEGMTHVVRRVMQDIGMQKAGPGEEKKSQKCSHHHSRHARLGIDGYLG